MYGGYVPWGALCSGDPGVLELRKKDVETQQEQQGQKEPGLSPKTVLKSLLLCDVGKCYTLSGLILNHCEVKRALWYRCGKR